MEALRFIVSKMRHFSFARAFSTKSLQECHTTCVLRYNNFRFQNYHYSKLCSECLYLCFSKNWRNGRSTVNDFLGCSSVSLITCENKASPYSGKRLPLLSPYFNHKRSHFTRLWYHRNKEVHRSLSLAVSPALSLNLFCHPFNNQISRGFYDLSKSLVLPSLSHLFWTRFKWTQDCPEIAKKRLKKESERLLWRNHVLKRRWLLWNRGYIQLIE